MTTLPLTVVAHEGPMARAYLVRLAKVGFRVQRVVLMVTARHPATGTPIAPWLPESLRCWYARQVLRQANLHWPRWLLAKQCGLVDAMVRGLESIDPLASEVIHEMFGPFDYRNYGDIFDILWTDGFRDERFVMMLRSIAPAAVLYTGGGLLPKDALTIDGIRWLHVHPGYLPDVRGADGLLWSVLLRGRPGISCFYMSPGIDEGDLIAAHDLESLRFDLAETPRPDDQSLYRALFSFCDPLLRAQFLAEHVVCSGSDLLALPSEPQDPSEGTTCHFMHARLRGIALRKLFA